MRKLFTLVAILAVTILSSWAPRAEASAGCSTTYCAGKPLSTPCGCPSWTDRPGAAATCGNWNHVGGCWYE